MDPIPMSQSPFIAGITCVIWPASDAGQLSCAALAVPDAISTRLRQRRAILWNIVVFYLAR